MAVVKSEDEIITELLKGYHIDPKDLASQRLKGLWKGKSISEHDIEEAKRSLFDAKGA
jgi:hypothetical protein